MKKNVKMMNKFLSFLHMGAATFRIYLKEAKGEELNDILSNNIKKFKEHEQEITKTISLIGTDPTDKTTFMEKRVLMVEKIKCDQINDDTKLALYALKAIDMGLRSSLEFLLKNKANLADSFIECAKHVIAYYSEVVEELKAFILKSI